jgi:catechol 2,3-dioxygenase-like lactoylglutathione lyase family enzyme
MIGGLRPPILRVARATNDLAPLRRFYGDGLGFEELHAFEDHDGFDGVMLGHPDWPYHLEFTLRRGHVVAGAPTAENLLVFYLPDPGDWTRAVARMQATGFEAVPAVNPYWDRQGASFADADGYRVVFQNAGWSR